MSYEEKIGTHFALFPVQVELVLTDGHHPDGFNQRVAGIPCVNNQTGLSKSALGHCSPVEGNETFRPYVDLKSKACSVTPHKKIKQFTIHKHSFN